MNFVRSVGAICLAWSMFVLFGGSAQPGDMDGRSSETVSATPALQSPPTEKPVSGNRIRFTAIPRFVPAKVGVPEAEITSPSLFAGRTSATTGTENAPAVQASIWIAFRPTEPISQGVHGPSEPRGVDSVIGERAVRTSDGKRVLGREQIWRWTPPTWMRSGTMASSRLRDPRDTSHRFKPLVISGMRAPDTPYVHLLLFESDAGLIWERDITNLCTNPPSSDAIDEPMLQMMDVACTTDGRYTLVSLAPQFVSAKRGSRLLVFGARGSLDTRTELDGIAASAFRRTLTGQHFMLTCAIKFTGEERFKARRTSALVLLRRDGAIAGTFVDDQGDLVYDSLLFANDDSAVASPNRGILYDLTQPPAPPLPE